VTLASVDWRGGAGFVSFEDGRMKGEGELKARDCSGGGEERKGSLRSQLPRRDGKKMGAAGRYKR
jgi:hypothetical protein